MLHTQSIISDKAIIIMHFLENNTIFYIFMFLVFYKTCFLANFL